MILNFSPAVPNISKEILDIGGKQIPYFRTQRFAKIMKENEEMTLKLVGCNDGRVVFLTSSGTGGMDAIVSNLISKEDRVLLINGGSFGQRFKDICDFYKINVYDFKVEFGKEIDFDKLIKIIDDFRPSIILSLHVETSSSQKYNIKKIGTICKENNIKLIVDAIGSFGNDEYKMDDWNVDATLISSHKGLGLFPGTSAVILNKRFYSGDFAKRSFYFDFNKYLKYDLSNEMAMPFTPNISSFIQMNYKLKEIIDMGIDKKIDNVRIQATHFRELIKDLPLTISSNNLSNCLTTLFAERNDVMDFFRKMEKKSIYFSPSGSNKLVVTHMGDVCKEDNIKFVEELREWLK